MAITVLPKPCVEIRCDECGEGDNWDLGGCFHYESEAAAIEAVDGADWRIFRRADGSVRHACCESCWDEMPDERRAALTEA